MLVGFIYSIPPDSVAEYDTPGEDIRLIHGPSKSIITSFVEGNKAATTFAFHPMGHHCFGRKRYQSLQYWYRCLCESFQRQCFRNSLSCLFDCQSQQCRDWNISAHTNTNPLNILGYLNPHGTLDTILLLCLGL